MPNDAYAAYTDACTFFLDENGVCVRAVLTRRAPDDLTRGGRTRAHAAERCVGAQYVASIDRGVAGGLVAMPQAGAPLLFAYLGRDGRIAIIRSGPLVRFERLEDRATLQPAGDETRHEPRDEPENSMTLPRQRPGRQIRPPAAPWAALHRAAGLRSSPMSVRAPRDSAPTWKDVQPPAPLPAQRPRAAAKR